MRGRKPKPTKLKIMAGKPGHRPLPKGEPVPITKAEVPKWLSADAVKVWEDLAPETERLGLLTGHYAEQFGMLCTELANYRKNLADVPSTRAMLIKALYAEFGMGPSAITRISVPKKDQGNDETRFFGVGA